MFHFLKQKRFFFVFIGIALFLGLFFVLVRDLKREIRFPIDQDNPFAQEGIAPGSMRGLFVRFWEKEFWMSYPHAQASLLTDYQAHEKGDRLLKFSDPKSVPELFGISEEKIRQAFGDPVSIQQTPEGFTVWAYHPWQDHSDWEILVYVRNEKLVGIGEIHPAAFGEEVVVEDVMSLDIVHKMYSYETIVGIRGITNKEEMMRLLDAKEYREEDLIKEERGRAPLGILFDTRIIPLQNTYCGYSIKSETKEISLFRCQDQFNRELFLGKTYHLEAVRYIDPFTQQELLLPTILTLIDS